ncbi:hypothetical protein ZIOFF_048957 [Zingiber officinale]|uniref:Uncharacterized protein n=1 Tax=Zingiber officinale TaxID=94328 RepID=A0A8J5KN30_ZINOF|nr:hypothetical protein ZIOFF_048957 [Zingiber officinale]
MEGEKTSLSAGAGATSKLPAVKGSKYNPTSENHIKKVVSGSYLNPFVALLHVVLPLIELPLYIKCILAEKDGKSQGCASRRQGSKDARPAQPAEPIESAYFGSSVNYGARDFYTSSLIMNTSETPSTYRKDGGNDLGSSDFATRGEWWQGSLYY